VGTMTSDKGDLAKHLQKLMESKELTNMQFTTNDQNFQVHAEIMKVRFPELGEWISKGVVSAEAAKVLIKFAYTDNIGKVTSTDLLKEILQMIYTSTKSSHVRLCQLLFNELTRHKNLSKKETLEDAPSSDKNFSAYLQKCTTKHTDSSLGDDIYSLLQRPDLSDITLEITSDVERNERCEMRLHKCILAARCPFFGRMFAGNFIENQQKSVHHKTALPISAFKAMIHYFYSGFPSTLGILDALWISDESAYYMIDTPSLLEMCHRKLTQKVTPDNWQEMVRLAEHTGNTKLLKEAQKFS